MPQLWQIVFVAIAALHQPLRGGELCSPLDLFPNDHVLDIRIEVKAGDWDMLRHQFRSFRRALSSDRRTQVPPIPYSIVPATVTIDGIKLPKVGLRKKGFIGSQSSTRPSLKIKLDEFDKDFSIGGITRLTLNNNRQDPTQLSQYLGYRFFRSAGIPSPRCSLAQVTINGVNLGVYSNVESVRRPFLRKWFSNDNGTLFEGTVIDFFAGWDKGFEKKVGKGRKARKRIRQLTASIKGPPGVRLLSSKSPARLLVPTDGSLGNKWQSMEFNENKWQLVHGTIGYDRDTKTGLFAPEQDIADEFTKKNTAVYLRYRFKLSDKKRLEQFNEIVLRMKYDDGFVAFLNGERIASANAPAELEWNSQATHAQNDRRALVFESFDLGPYRHLFKAGENILAVQILNVHPQSTDLFGSVEIRMRNFDAEQSLHKYVDLNAFYQFWVAESLVGFWDGYSGNRNNFFIYFNPKSAGRISFIPWGADSLFEKYSHLPHDKRAPISVKIQGRLAHLLYQSPNGRERYKRVMRNMLVQHWNERQLVEEIDRMEKMLKPHLNPSQRTKFRTDRLRAFIKTRRTEIEKETQSGMPLWTRPPTSPPTIQRNEVKEDRNSIWVASRRGDIGHVNRLLKQGVDVNSRDANVATALSAAALGGQLQMAKLLLEKGADKSAVNNAGQSPLHTAAFLGHIDVAQLLIQHNADIGLKSKTFETPLDVAASDWERVKELVLYLSDSLDLRLNLDRVRRERMKVAHFLRQKVKSARQPNTKEQD